MNFQILRILYLAQFSDFLHHYSPNDSDDDLPNYDRENELDEKCCPVQVNGNKHYACAEVIPHGENADGLDENGKKGVRVIGFQLPK